MVRFHHAPPQERFKMNNCKVCSKEIPDSQYYCNYECYAVAVPAAKMLIDFVNKRDRQEIKMETNDRIAKYIKIFGAVLIAICLAGGIYSFVHPVTSGPTLDQQNEVNHVK